MKTYRERIRLFVEHFLKCGLCAVFVTMPAVYTAAGEKVSTTISEEILDGVTGEWIAYRGGGYWIKRITGEREVFETYSFDGVRRSRSDNALQLRIHDGILHCIKLRPDGSPGYEGVYKPQDGKLYEYTRALFVESPGRPQVFEWRRMDEPIERWFRAVRNGDLQTLERELEDGGNLNATASGSFNAMAFAAAAGQLRVIRFLKERGASVSARSGWYGARPIAEAARHGQTEACALLLEMGADIDEAANFGWTALHEAVGNGHPLTAKYLLGKGANRDARNSAGDTALHLAIKRGNRALAKLLLKAGASPDIRDNQGKTAADIARQNGMLQALPESISTREN
ncbi:MAG: hypothetical protein CMO80_16430 [Verrucomicrobiales bacterium]|nr:hypothetical protein [Verrucomicrobiales bacterium]